MSVHEFLLQKRIADRLGEKGQWMVKTPEGDPKHKELGRWSRWRKNPDRWVGGYEVLETHIELLELAKRIGVFNPTVDKFRA